MSADAQRLPDAALTIHTLWTSPLFVAASIIYLVSLVGVSGVAGLAVLAATVPLQAFVAVKQMGIQRTQMKRTDARLKLVNEILQVLWH